MGALLDDIKIPIEMAHYRQIQQIENQDFTIYKLKATQETGNQDQCFLDRSEHYLKRYYALHVLDPLNTIALSKNADFLWHFHMSYTEDYLNFCNSIFGDFIHHQPLLYSDLRAVEYVHDLYRYTYDLSKSVFKTMDEEIFPESAELGACCNSLNGNVHPFLRDAALFPRREEVLSLV